MKSVSSALAIGGAAVLFVGSAHASPIAFESTVSLTESVGKLSFASTGLNDTLTVGVPDVISQFISVTVGNGAWSTSNSALTASFTFTLPIPSGATTDTGSITGAQVNGRNAAGNLSVVWPNQPFEFDFADGTKLAITLADLFVSCSSGNNCLAGNTYHMAGTFLLLNGPTPDFAAAVVQVPLPGALVLFASGLGALGFMGRRSRRRHAARVG
jgi:hypothetical protein